MAQGVGTVTVGTHAGSGTPLPVKLIPFSFAGDGAYESGGTVDWPSSTTGFQAYARKKLGQDVTLLGIIPQDCGGYVPTYLPTTDALKVYWHDNTNGKALEEVTTSQDLSGATFNVLLICY